MNSSQIEFLHILGDYINKRKRDYEISSEILSYAKSQEVEGIIYRQTQMPTLQKKFASSIFYHENWKRIIADLDIRLSKTPHFFVKGLVMAQYYPNPALRTMGDIDIVIKKDDISKVKKVLEECGFDLHPEIETVIVANRASYEIEVHSSLIHSGIGSEFVKDYFSHCWDYVKDNTLNEDYHFVFIIQHLKGHMISKGVGFRQFMDVALFSMEPGHDWEWISDELGKVGLLEFAKTVFAFIQLWFDVKSPIETIEVEERFYEEATEKIFSGGVFGHEDKTNQNVGIVKQAVNSRINLKNARKQYLLKQIFPTFQTMCTLPYCSYVKKTRLLLPVAWIHRIIYRGLNRKHREEFIDRIDMNAGLQERLDLLQKWGIR